MGGGRIPVRVRREPGMGGGPLATPIGWGRRAGEPTAGKDRADAGAETVTGRIRDGSDPGGACQGIWSVTAPHRGDPRSPGHWLSYARMSDTTDIRASRQIALVA